MSPDSVTMNQIDHIAISIKHWVFLKDVGTFRGADIGLTDHYLLRAKLRMKVSKASNIQPPQLYDTKKKLVDPYVRVSFRVSMEEKFRDTSLNILESLNTPENVNTLES